MANERDPLTHAVLGAAIQVHRELGPGLLESAYAVCLAHEFVKRGISFEQGRRLDVTYDGRRMRTHYRLDLVVQDRLVVELKSVDSLLPVHVAQILTYLKLSGIRTGLLVNFNVVRLMQGVIRVVL